MKNLINKNNIICFKNVEVNVYQNGKKNVLNEQSHVHVEKYDVVIEKGIYFGQCLVLEKTVKNPFNHIYINNFSFIGNKIRSLKNEDNLYKINLDCSMKKGNSKFSKCNCRAVLTFFYTTVEFEIVSIDLKL